LGNRAAFNFVFRALVGFLLSLTPLSMDLMGWRGAGGNGAAGTGTYYFFGGLCMILGGVGEVRTCHIATLHGTATILTNCE